MPPGTTWLGLAEVFLLNLKEVEDVELGVTHAVIFVEKYPCQRITDVIVFQKTSDSKKMLRM